jgi:C-terminal processing protease CtpA/Prc
MEYVEASRALYLRCTDIRSVPSGLTGAFRDGAAQPDVDRVVVDLRQNPGGDNHEYPPMLSILEEWSAAHPGRLFVITDRVTFSAASNFATELEQRTDATFIGEAMGGGLNFWDDVTWIDLDALPIPMRVGVSTRYWEMSVPDDPRLTIEPDIAVPVTAEDYFDDLDPALVIALTAPPVD